MFKIEALLMAAGESKRFGAAKQVSIIQGFPMIMHVLRAFQQAKLSSITLVLGAHFSKVNEVLLSYNVDSQNKSKDQRACIPETPRKPIQNDMPTKTLQAKQWKNGMGASIAEGVSRLEQDSTHVMIGLADQVDIGTQQCNILIDMSKKNPSKIVAAYYNQKLGAPAIFPRRYFSELAALSNDKGAREILRANKQHVIAIDMPEAERDIDTKHDLLTYELDNKKFLSENKT